MTSPNIVPGVRYSRAELFDFPRSDAPPHRIKAVITKESPLLGRAAGHQRVPARGALY
jgi:hypothetical protein